ncbi:HAMP domain-containing sensor histidine kinase, partial [Cecembia sp.]
KRNVDGLFVTLDNILSWSRAQMEGFKVQLRPTDSLQIIRECIELLQQHAEGKGITFHIDVNQEIKLWVDTDLLQIILRNLIGNAVKYSRKNSEIKIEASEEGDFVKLSISDQGIGISKEKLEQIKNQKFSLLDSSTGTDNERGTGLGINLCKEFTRLMGGAIEFESKRNVGTKVSLKFRRVRVLSNSQNSPQQKHLV